MVFKKVKKLKAFKKPRAIDSVMKSEDLFNVSRSISGLSTAPGMSALDDIGSTEGRRLSSKAKTQRATLEF